MVSKETVHPVLNKPTSTGQVVQGKTKKQRLKSRTDDEVGSDRGTKEFRSTTLKKIPKLLHCVIHYVENIHNYVSL